MHPHVKQSRWLGNSEEIISLMSCSFSVKVLGRGVNGRGVDEFFNQKAEEKIGS